MFSLYFISDRKLTPSESPEKSLLDAIKAGVEKVQIREKDLASRELLNLVRQVVAAASGSPTEVFVNSRFDIAMAAGAHGVHLPASGLRPADVRSAVGSGLKIGVSVHSPEEASLAENEGADFVTFGPVFETPSKRKYGPPQGLDKLKTVAEIVKIPVYGVGGINSENVNQLVGTGAAGVAIISAFAKSTNRNGVASSLRSPG